MSQQQHGNEPKVLNLERMKALQDKEDAGEWYTYHEGGEFLVAFVGRDDFQRRYSRMEERFRSRRPDLKKRNSFGNFVKPMDSDMADEVTARAMYGTIVLAWRKVGEPPIEFTEDNFVTVMDGVRGLGAAILSFSGERENFRQQEIEAAAGNS